MINFKRGDTFILPKNVMWQDKEAGVRYPLSGVGIKCHIRKGNELVDSLVATVTDAAAGEFELRCSGSTDTWKTGVLSADIEFTLDTGQKLSTQTFYINCVKDETR